MLVNPRPALLLRIWSSKPLPLSAIVISALSPVRCRRTSAFVASACLTTLCSASCAIRTVERGLRVNGFEVPFSAAGHLERV